MNGSASLERGYRRLLVCYPRRFRRENGEELLAVLLASAKDGQQRPGLLERADLIRNGLVMRVRPDVSQSARYGWSDALAVYSLTAPVLLLLNTVVSCIWFWATPEPGALKDGFWGGFGLSIAAEAVVAALVIAGWRKTALAVLVPAGVLLAFEVTPGIGANTLIGWGLFLLEAVALIGSPGPRHGRRLAHRGHWIVLLAPVLAFQAFASLGSFDRNPLVGLGGVLILAFVFNWLSRALCVGRYFQLLLVATFYPLFFIVAANWYFNPLWMSQLGAPAALSMLYAGPLLGAAAGLGAALRPRRRRII